MPFDIADFLFNRFWDERGLASGAAFAILREILEQPAFATTLTTHEKGTGFLAAEVGGINYCMVVSPGNEIVHVFEGPQEESELYQAEMRARQWEPGCRYVEQ